MFSSARYGVTIRPGLLQCATDLHFVVMGDAFPPFSVPLCDSAGNPGKHAASPRHIDATVNLTLHIRGTVNGSSRFWLNVQGTEQESG